MSPMLARWVYEPKPPVEPEKKMVNPTTDLAFVSDVVSRVVHALIAHADNTEDVVVAAKYINVARDFPIHFICWAAQFHRDERELAAQGIPEWATKVRRMCEEIPVIASFDTSHVLAGNVAGATIELPAVCIEAFILASVAAKTEPELIAASRQINAARASQFAQIYSTSSGPPSFGSGVGGFSTSL